MRILYVVQYFNLPHEPGGSRPYQFARAWVAAGHQVTILTGAVNHKTLTVPERYRGRLAVVEEIEGIRVVRCWSYAGIRGSFRKRVWNFLSFALVAFAVGLVRGGGADIVYASSTPLTVGVPGWLLAVCKRARFVFEVRDLWPESAVALGVLEPGRWSVRIAGALSRWLYRRAARVVALTRGIADGVVAHGIDRGKTMFVPNGVDDWMADAAAAGGDERPAPPPRPFQVLYVGAHGRANCLGTVLDAAALLAGDESIRFDFYGDGDEKARLMARAERERLDNVAFHPAVSKREGFELARRAGVALAGTWDEPFQRMVLANKIFDYLAAGCPVVVHCRGEMAELVEEAGAGRVVPPEDPPALARAIRELAATPVEERLALGERGRRFVLERFQRRDLAADLLEAFAEITGLPAGVTRRRGGTRDGARVPERIA